MVSFHCCVAAWVSTSKSVFCQFGELCYWNIILPPVGPFMLTREDRMILPRILTSLLKQHIAYRCALCARLVNGIKKDTLIQLQHRISAKSLMYYCYIHQRAVLVGIPSFEKLPWRVVRRSKRLNHICNFFRVVTKHRLGPFQQVSSR